MTNNGNPSLRQSILSGILGALAFVLSSYLITWFFSVSPTFELIKFAMAQFVGLVNVGAFVGALCNRYRIKRSFGVAFTTQLLTYATMFTGADALGVPLDSSLASFYVSKLVTIPTNWNNDFIETILWNVSLIVIGFVIALLIIGLIMTGRRLHEKQK